MTEPRTNSKEGTMPEDISITRFLGAILLLVSIAMIVCCTCFVFYLHRIDTKLDMLEVENKIISSRLDFVPSGKGGESEYFIAYLYINFYIVL